MVRADEGGEERSVTSSTARTSEYQWVLVSTSKVADGRRRPKKVEEGWRRLKKFAEGRRRSKKVEDGRLEEGGGSRLGEGGGSRWRQVGREEGQVGREGGGRGGGRSAVNSTKRKKN